MVELEQRARSIFLQALALDADHRTAFIANLCGNEPALRARVERLYSSKDALGDFKDSQSDKSCVERVANFESLERIGEGGFGEVYSAKQTFPVKRQVALKLLKRGMDSDRVIARFEIERQTLAVMDHPNVATI